MGVENSRLAEVIMNRFWLETLKGIEAQATEDEKEYKKKVSVEISPGAARRFKTKCRGAIRKLKTMKRLEDEWKAINDHGGTSCFTGFRNIGKDAVQVSRSKKYEINYYRMNSSMNRVASQFEKEYKKKYPKKWVGKKGVWCNW